MKSFLNPSAAVTDAVLLITRILLGVVMIAHGSQKFFDQGIDTVSKSFDGMGIPLPTVAAYFTASVELVGGVLLVVGALTVVVGVLFACVMAGAFWFTHREAGLFASEGGWEFVAVLGAFALALAAVGPGRYSVDSMATGRR
ncbi:DoxX family protein [Demetria terragena]|uniref:DoxX family protein n=1 Tax=Demetria terragena TaxID=63959 RepID=UPI000380EF49|nr:DoxX family protein [Demetria terragena]